MQRNGRLRAPVLFCRGACADRGIRRARDCVGVTLDFEPAGSAPKARSRPDRQEPPMSTRRIAGMLERLIVGFDRALRTLSGTAVSARPTPGAHAPEAALTPEERRHAAGLMRVNHTGEVCAQALYSAQSLVARDPMVRERFAAAAREEEDHLAWTEARLAELNSRTSLLNPLWYAGAFGIGLLAGVRGDRGNLGFVVETERQVEEHLTGHMDRLPARDSRSRAIVERMREDEARHAVMAQDAGGERLPFPLRGAMRLAADVMRGVAYRI
jgi:ubiquinone biosynthesis monooxygenase Coq7